MMRARTLILAGLLCCLVTGRGAAEVLATLTVSAGDHARQDTPVQVVLPATIKDGQPLRLFEVTDAGREPVVSQVEHSRPPRLWFVLSGKTEAGAKRRFELQRGEPIQRAVLEVDLTSRTLDVRHGDAPIFSYNHAHVIPPEGIRREYIRSGYMHPVYSPGGKLITEDFPGDHHHHKGIWFPWTKTEFEGHEVDFWNLGKKQGTVQFTGFDSIDNGPVFAGFRAEHEFVDLTQPAGGKVALDETWDVRVYTVGGPDAGYWLWDITSEQRCASPSPLELKRYRYGGMAFRGPKEWKGDNYVLLTSEGKTKKNGHTTRARWCAHSGAVDGKWSTVVVMCSPQNERFPEPMRIWASGGAFFNYAPIQAGDWTLKPGEDYVFSYRFFVHEGKIDAEKAERAWQDFGRPPTVVLKLAK